MSLLLWKSEAVEASNSCDTSLTEKLCLLIGCKLVLELESLVDLPVAELLLQLLQV